MKMRDLAIHGACGEQAFGVHGVGERHVLFIATRRNCTYHQCLDICAAIERRWNAVNSLLENAAVIEYDGETNSERAAAIGNILDQLRDLLIAEETDQ